MANVIANFFIEAEEVPFKSQQEGRPIYEDREKIMILTPGAPKSEVVALVTQQHIDRFPEEYRKFKAGLAAREQMTGTPLSQFPALKAYQIKELEGVHVYTVENLAGLADTAVQSIGMGGLELRAKARAYLEQAKETSAATRYAAENEHLKSEVEMLKAQVAELGSLLKEAGEVTPEGTRRRKREARETVLEL